MIDPVEFGKSMGAIVREAVDPLLKRIADLETKQLERGEKGDPGERGADAEPVEISAVAAELIDHDGLKTLVSLLVAEGVEDHFKLHPVINGKDGDPGKDGVGIKGDPGETGKDGAGIADLLIDRDGALVATMTDGRTKSLGVVIGKDGAPGKDGQDLSDVSIDYDGHRTIAIKAKGGEVASEYVLPVPLDAGYWTDGKASQKGDVVTHDGNAWIALCDNKSKPCHENKLEWRMLARKGRDGRDGANGKDLGPKPPVKLGDKND